MVNGKQLKELTKARLKVAKLLFIKGDFNGVVDNVGWAVELALKAMICTKLLLASYPESITDPKDESQKRIVSIFKHHDFTALLTLAGLSSFFVPDPTNSKQLNFNWGYITSRWSPEVRYEPIGTYDGQTAENMIKAAVDKPDGVISFIMKRW